jgi:hypothetical protein
LTPETLKSVFQPYLSTRDLSHSFISDIFGIACSLASQLSPSGYGLEKEKPMNRKLQKAELDAAIVKALVEQSHKSYLQLAREFGVSTNYVTAIVLRNGLCRKRGRGSPAWKPKHEGVN